MAGVGDVTKSSNEDYIRKMVENGARRNTLDTGLNVNDFLGLLASQMQNQDMMNPMKDAEFMSQLAQFTSLQAMQNVNETSMTSYAASLLGQNITALEVTTTGDTEIVEGVVTGVGFFEGTPTVFIGDKVFSLPQVMAVGKLPEVKPPEGGGDGDGGDGDGGDGGDDGNNTNKV